MSQPLTVEELSKIRVGARRNRDWAAAHQDHLERWVSRAETEVAQAEASLAAPPDASPYYEQLITARRGRLERSHATVGEVRELCAEARAHHLAAEQLADDVGDGVAPTDTRGRPTPAVLIVDDHDDSRELMALVLQEAGVVVHTARNGLEALILAHEVRPALIFMDLHMPVLDGIEATRLIRAIDALRHAPIVAYTSQPSVDSPVARALFTAILEKPALPHVLLATVQRFAKA